MLGNFEEYTFVSLKPVQCSFTSTNISYKPNECLHLCSYLLNIRTDCTSEQNFIPTEVLWSSYTSLRATGKSLKCRKGSRHWNNQNEFGVSSPSQFLLVLRFLALFPIGIAYKPFLAFTLRSFFQGGYIMGLKIAIIKALIRR